MVRKHAVAGVCFGILALFACSRIALYAGFFSGASSQATPGSETAAEARGKSDSIQKIRRFETPAHAKVQKKKRIVVCVTGGNARQASIFTRFGYFGKYSYEYMGCYENCRNIHPKELKALLRGGEEASKLARGFQSMQKKVKSRTYDRCNATVALPGFNPTVSWVPGDEFCKHKSRAIAPDYAQYWTAERNGQRFLPLGPRFEFAPVEDREVQSPSQRKYLFNFVGSTKTSLSRKRMIEQVDQLILRNASWLTSIQNAAAARHLPQRTFVQTSEQWSRNPNLERNGYISSDKFRRVLLSSVFTLSPAGHNPECFRMYEAAESGSIPIVPLDRTYLAHSCRKALDPIIRSRAPFIFIAEWSQLRDYLDDFYKRPEKYEAQQRAVRAWYASYMANATRAFEALLEQRMTME